MTAITEEALSVSGILLAKVFNRSPQEVARYREANQRQTRLQVEQAMAGRTFFAVVQTFFAITPALIYLVAGWIITGSSVAAPTRSPPAPWSRSRRCRAGCRCRCSS